MGVAYDAPRIGAAVLVLHGHGDNLRLLMIQRAGAHGADTWSIPGGNVDPNETPAEGAARELEEETWLVIEPILLREVPHWTFTRFPEIGRSYLTVYFVVRVTDMGKATIREPEKCLAMKWISEREGLPSTLFAPLANLVEMTRGLWPYLHKL